MLPLSILCNVPTILQNLNHPPTLFPNPIIIYVSQASLALGHCDATISNQNRVFGALQSTPKAWLGVYVLRNGSHTSFPPWYRRVSRNSSHVRKTRKTLFVSRRF